MNFDDTNHEYTDCADTPNAERGCPYCEKRPLGKRKNARTCGHNDCMQAHVLVQARKTGHAKRLAEREKRPAKAICPYCNARPLNEKKSAKTCGDIDCRKAAKKAYNSRPDVREKENARKRTPEVRAQENARRRTPEYREKKNAGRRTPEYRAKRQEERKRPHIHAREIEYKRQYRQSEHGREVIKKHRNLPHVVKYNKEYLKDYLPAYRKDYDQRDYVKKRVLELRDRPEAKAKRKAYSQRPEVIDARREWGRLYRSLPSVQTRMKLSRKARGNRAYPRGWGGPSRKWEMQRRMCALGWSEFDGRSYRQVNDWLHSDHLVPKKLLHKVGIIDKSVVNLLENIWLVCGDKNISKKDRPLHHWLERIGAPKPVVDCGKEWYEATVAIIVAKQQEIDPSYVLTDERRTILGLDD